MDLLGIFKDRNKKLRRSADTQKLQESLVLSFKNVEAWQKETQVWKEEARLWRDKYLDLQESKAPVFIEAQEAKKIKTTLSKEQEEVYRIYLKLKNNPKEECTSRRIAAILKQNLNTIRVKIDRIQKKLEKKGEPRMEFDID